MDQNCKYCGTPLAGYETICPGCGRELLPEADTAFRPKTADDTYKSIPAAKRPTSAHSMIDEEWFPADIVEPSPYRSARTAVPQRKSTAHRPSPEKRRPPAEPVSISGKPRIILLAVLAVAAILLIMLGVNLLRGGEKRDAYPFASAIDAYFTSVRTANAEKFIATRPAAYTAYLTSGSGSAYENESLYRSETAAALHSRLDEYKADYGNISSITYDLTSVSRYNHRCDALSDVLTNWYNFPEKAVNDAYIVSGTYTLHGSDADGTHAITELLLIRIDDEWYFSPDAGSYWKGE